MAKTDQFRRAPTIPNRLAQPPILEERVPNNTKDHRQMNPSESSPDYCYRHLRLWKDTLLAYLLAATRRSRSSSTRRDAGEDRAPS
jgi:hypothetical protein